MDAFSLQKIPPLAQDAVQRMFLHTADENYIVARWAALNGMYVDFYWLAAHALEKYAKCILLLNGNSVKEHRHSVFQLYQRILDFRGDLEIPAFECPTWFPSQLWTKHTVPSFLERLDIFGSPNNRYLMYGFNVSPCDLIRLDHLVWSLRRFCRPLVQSRSASGLSGDEDIVGRLKSSRQLCLHGSSLIERCIRAPNSNMYKDVLIPLNNAFFPEIAHQIEEYSASSREGPLSDRIHLLQNGDEDTREEVAEAFTWLLNNIHFSKEDRRELLDLMKAAKDRATLRGD